MTEASKGYVSLFDLGESKDDVEVDYNSLYMHHYKVKLAIAPPALNHEIMNHD